MPTELTKLRITQDIIDSLRSNAERKLHWSDIKARLDTITEDHLFIGGDIPSGTKFFRGRELADGEIFGTTDELTAREPSEITSYGRCHSPKNSIFYGSNKLETVFSELGLDVGSRVQIIEVRLKPLANVRYTMIGAIDHVRRYGEAPPQLGDGYRTTIQGHLDSLSEAARMRLSFVDAFVAEHFARPAKHPFEYKVTSAFSDIVFEQKVDAFFYPSVGHRGGRNIAVPKSTFDENFEIVSCTVYRIFDAPGYGMFGQFIEHQSEEIKEDNFQWLAPTDLDQKFESFDSFLQYALCEPGTPYLLVQPFSYGEIELPEVVISKLEAARPRTAKDEHMTARLDNIFTFALNSEVSFEKLSDVTTEKSANWDGVILDVLPNISSQEELDRSVNEYLRVAENGKPPFAYFLRDGSSKQILASVPFKLEKH